MPVTSWSAAGTGWKNAFLEVHDVVLTAADVRNQNTTDRAEAAQIRVYQGASLDTGVENYDVLASGWAFGNLPLHWSGRIVLQGDHIIVGTVNHASSVTHALDVQYEKLSPISAGAPLGWAAFWRSMWGTPV